MKVITKDEWNLYFYKFSPLPLEKMPRGNKWEFRCWYYGLISQQQPRVYSSFSSANNEKKENFDEAMDNIIFA